MSRRPNGSIDNLRAMLSRADSIDRREGALAYPRYGTVLGRVAEAHAWDYERVVAAFVALSPNSDYLGNLRSLMSVLNAVKEGRPFETVTVATYRHCGQRAYSYLTGEVDFAATVKGPKIRAFYFNILDPQDRQHVTIDGHMSLLWQGALGTMNEGIISRPTYRRIAADFIVLADELDLLPCQLQATLWFTRKRVHRIIYDPQGDLFHPDDWWKTLRPVDDIRPYP